jgi:hypothetical protein
VVCGMDSSGAHRNAPPYRRGLNEYYTVSVQEMAKQLLYRRQNGDG